MSDSIHLQIAQNYINVIANFNITSEGYMSLVYMGLGFFFIIAQCIAAEKTQESYDTIEQAILHGQMQQKRLTDNSFNLQVAKNLMRAYNESLHGTCFPSKLVSIVEESSYSDSEVYSPECISAHTNSDEYESQENASSEDSEKGSLHSYTNPILNRLRDVSSPFEPNEKLVS